VQEEDQVNALGALSIFKPTLHIFGLVITFDALGPSALATRSCLRIEYKTVKPRAEPLVCRWA